MTTNDKKILKNILESLKNLTYIKPEDIPNIDLYMDQVTTFMDTQLASTKRHPEDKILTKTMINNYTKNNLLPPPDKKKYSKEHLLTMIFIYYFKGIMSISDIQRILNPITDKYFSSKEGMNLAAIYQEVFGLEYDASKILTKDIIRKFNTSRHTFTEADENDRDDLQLFSFICMLCFDVYLKRMLVEKIIDAELSGEPSEKNKKEGRKK